MSKINKTNKFIGSLVLDERGVAVVRVLPGPSWWLEGSTMLPLSMTLVCENIHLVK